MKIEHKYFILTQQGERNNLDKLHTYMMDGWMPSREIPLENSSSTLVERFSPEAKLNDIVDKQNFSHCLILLFREIK